MEAPSRMVRPGMCRMVAIPKTRNNFGRHGRSSPPARRRSSLRVRSTFMSSRRSGRLVVTALAAGYMATVIAGPVEGEGIAWYQVSTPEVSKAGATGHICKHFNEFVSVTGPLPRRRAGMPARFGPWR